MHNVPPEFREHVERVLASEWMGERIGGPVWGMTPFGQYFVLVTSKYLWYAVRLIVDEEHRDLELASVFNVHNDDVLLKRDFLTYNSAIRYVADTWNKMEDGSFDDAVNVRVRRLPPDAFFFPDKYLKPGDHIQRSLESILPANHEGVYLGEGLVAHINGPSDATDLMGLSEGKKGEDVFARIDSFRKFAVHEFKEIRVLVHCIRHQSRQVICENARRLADGKYRQGDYHLLQQNCQHFASFCVLGREWMSDKEVRQEQVAKIGLGALFFGFAAFTAYHTGAINSGKTAQLAHTERRC